MICLTLIALLVISFKILGVITKLWLKVLLFAAEVIGILIVLAFILL